MSSGKSMITRESFISKDAGHGRCAHCGQLGYGSYYRIKLGRSNTFLFFCNEHTDDADRNAGIKKQLPLTLVTQSHLVQALRIDGHGVVSVHRFIAEDAGIEMIYTSSDGNKYRSHILIEHTGEVSMSQSQYDKRAKQYTPPQWVTLGIMFYVALKRYGYAVPALDNVYGGDNSLIDR